jgi:hypothetical protein
MNNGNFALVVQAAFETNSKKKFIQVVYNLLIESIRLSSFVIAGKRCGDYPLDCITAWFAPDQLSLSLQVCLNLLTVCA